jgi:hypothetical protein
MRFRPRKVCVAIVVMQSAGCEPALHNSMKVAGGAHSTIMVVNTRNTQVCSMWTDPYAGKPGGLPVALIFSRNRFAACSLRALSFVNYSGVAAPATARLVKMVNGAQPAC